MKKYSIISMCLLLVCILVDCSDMSPFMGELSENQLPVVELTNGPIEGDSVSYCVHFYWIGDDPDGAIDHYEIVMVDGGPIGFDPADTIGIDKWTSLTAADTLIKTSADEYDSTVTINNSLYAIYGKVHTFFIRAVDNRGGVSETVYRSFNSWTIAPHIFIDEPPIIGQAGGIQMVGPVIHFGWYGKDPIDQPWNYQNVDSVRYMYTYYNSMVINELNAHPEKFEHLWSRWFYIDAPGDSGTATILGDDELIPTGRIYIFAVQAKDEAGAISSVFDDRTNVRAFMAVTPTGPQLTVREKAMGSWSFIGQDLDPVFNEIPPGYEVLFSWVGDASSYGSIVSTYRYGWDIIDLSDPTQWETLPTPDLRSAKPKRFYSGDHTIYIEATDDLGISTICAIEMNVVPARMEQALLWIDDLNGSPYSQTDYSFPTEKSHSDFWIDICMKVPSFVPDRDVYRVYQSGCGPPSVSQIFKYKNIIWTHSNAHDPDCGSYWNRMLYWFYSEYFNFLPYYLEYGGHLWTSGIPGGLTSALRCYSSPCDVRAYDNREKLPYTHYCVNATMRCPWNLDSEGFVRARLASSDPVTSAHPGLPEELLLWDAVLQPGSFFNPLVRGFWYVEAYNPPSWMASERLSDQDCFNPIYIMRARSSFSLMDHSPIALWMSKYSDVASPSGTNVPARSVHFGVPLWYFDRAQVDSIASVIFEEWQILGAPQ